MNFTFPDLYNFLRGPGFAISMFIFLSGFLYRTLRLLHATRKISRVSFTAENFVHVQETTGNGSTLKDTFNFIKSKLKNSIFGTNPIMGIISLVFHILIFITPLFLSAHNIISDLTIRISLPSIPERVTDVFTVILIAMGGFFFARRILIPRVRIISTLRDYIIILLVIAPFLSGFFAYHHFFNYRIVIFTHMIIGEAAIMILPFTSLIHMPFIIFSRFFIDSEYSITTGNRRW